LVQKDNNNKKSLFFLQITDGQNLEQRSTFPCFLAEKAWMKTNKAYSQYSWTAVDISNEFCFETRTQFHSKSVNTL